MTDVPCLASPTAVIPVQRPAPSSSTGAASRGDDDDDDCVALYTRQEERVLLNEDDYIDAVEVSRDTRDVHGAGGLTYMVWWLAF